MKLYSIRIGQGKKVHAATHSIMSESDHPHFWRGWRVICDPTHPYMGCQATDPVDCKHCLRAMAKLPRTPAP